MLPLFTFAADLCYAGVDIVVLFLLIFCLFTVALNSFCNADLFFAPSDNSMTIHQQRSSPKLQEVRGGVNANANLKGPSPVAHPQSNIYSQLERSKPFP